MKAEIITSDELQELMSTIRQAHSDIEVVNATHRPSIANERYYTGEEFCSRLYISKRTLQNYRDEGVIPYTRIGDKILYRESDIQEVLARNYVAAIK